MSDLFVFGEEKQKKEAEEEAEENNTVESARGQSRRDPRVGGLHVRRGDVLIAPEQVPRDQGVEGAPSLHAASRTLAA